MHRMWKLGIVAEGKHACYKGSMMSRKGSQGEEQIGRKTDGLNVG